MLRLRRLSVKFEIRSNDEIFVTFCSCLIDYETKFNIKNDQGILDYF